MKISIGDDVVIDVTDGEVQLAAELVTALQKSKMVPAGTTVNMRTGEHTQVYRPAGEVAEERRQRYEERRQRAIGRAIKTNPDASDTEIVKIAGKAFADPETVAAYRKQMLVEAAKARVPEWR